jgi:hypothetical protein
MTDTTVIPTAGVQEVPDFGTAMEAKHPVPFKIDGEMYFGNPSLPAGVLFDMIEMVNTKDQASQIRLLDEFLKAMLVPESYERLKVKMRDQTNPLSIQQVMKITEYLMSAATGRPTTQSSSSQAGQSGTGPTSTGTAPTTV